MKMNHLAMLLTASAMLAVSGCSSAQSPAPTPPATQQRQAQAADGSSIERAVVIRENDTRRGIAAENAWIRAHMPGYQKVGQALTQGERGIYDRIEVRGPNGEQRMVFFEISSFFGRIDGKLIGQ